MLKIAYPYLWSIAILGVLSSLTACSLGGNAKVLYHTLAHGGAVSEISPQISRKIPSLGVGPVKLTSLLDRKGFVMRLDDNTVEVSDLHEWGAELEDEFIAALAQQLQARLPKTRVQRVPWEVTQTPKYQISMLVDQFDGKARADARLLGSWQLQHGADGRIIATYPLNMHTPVQGQEVQDIVKAQTRLMQMLAQDVVSKLGVVK